MTPGQPPAAPAPPDERRRSSTLRQVVGGALSVAFVALVVVVALQRRDELEQLFSDPGPELVAVGVLVLGGHFLNSTEFWLLYRAQGLAIGLWETWLLFLANQLGNLLPGQVGSVYRFRYLKVVHGFEYAQSTSNYAANLVISFGSSALAGLTGLFLVAAGGGTFSPVLLWVGIALAVLTVVLMAAPPPAMPWLPARVGRTWTTFRGGWRSIQRQPHVAAAVLVIDVVKYLLVAWRFQIAFGLLDVHEPYAYFLVLAPAAGLAGALAFTPGGLGIRELFVTAAAVGLGSSFDTGLLAASVDRGVMLLTALAFGSVGMVLTRRRMVTAAVPVGSA
jgi:uncharacterized membrane protein YbhN (UPF0104 family)